MATHRIFSLVIAVAIISDANAAGVTIDIIHRDSPGSPFFSNTTSRLDKLYAAIRRSNARAREISLRARGAKPSVPVHPTDASYLAELGIGTPPKRFLAELDTGSDLTWTQCTPCAQCICFGQKLPVFDPNESTSYKSVSCDSELCNDLRDINRGCSTRSTCTYRNSYLDKSFTMGDLATESLTLGFGRSATDELIHVPIGCGHRNQLTNYITPMTAGILGMSQGPLSFPSQTQHIDKFGGKFAYCLVPTQGAFREGLKSKLSFGGDAVVSGGNKLSIPFTPGPSNRYYYLSLKGVSVGRQTLIPFESQNRPSSGSGSNMKDHDQLRRAHGNLIVDCGSTLTYLPEKMYDRLVSDLMSQIRGPTIGDPTGQMQLCYLGDIEVPKITLHFAEGTIGLPRLNTFMKMRHDIYCLAMLPAERGFALLGNFAQTNAVVAYDLEAKKITFKGTRCETYVPSSH